ncbi:MAG TPA: histidine phosphotransferase family protein [Dongiaceae bacterium]|jgi:histidine phosphotransferase ChpT|nr:histidine phosphotransferase family protein [Dongiaceae bacterium]
MDIDLQILELVCSRLCHDLISPIGAVGNGLELMAEEADQELLDDARRLVEDSSRRAGALLQLYRSAYGNAGNQPAFGVNEAVRLAKDAFDANRLALTATVPGGVDWPAGYGKLVLNAILTASEWLPRGGTLSLTVENAVGFQVAAEGQQAACPKDSERLIQLDRAGIEVSAHNIQPYLTGFIAARQNCRLAVSQPAAGTAILSARKAA